MNAVKKLRIQNNWTQFELSKRSGVSQSHIHYLETGSRKPTINVLSKLARAFKVTVPELLVEEMYRRVE